MEIWSKKNVQIRTCNLLESGIIWFKDYSNYNVHERFTMVFAAYRVNWDLRVSCELSLASVCKPEKRSV